MQQPPSISEQEIKKLNEILKVAYETDMGGLKTNEITKFETTTMKRTLESTRRLLLERRRALVSDLHEQYQARTDSGIIALREKYRAHLVDSDTSLSRILQESESLSSSTSQLSLEFVKITDRLDSATSNVARADAISTILKYIQCFNSSPKLEIVEKALRAAGFPFTNLHLAAEQIVKLHKIVSITEKSAKIENAKITISEYKKLLTKRLKRCFKSTSDLQTRSKCVNSLSSLGALDKTIKAYVKRLPFYQDENFRFKSELLDQTPKEMIDYYSDACDYFLSQCSHIWTDIDNIFERTMPVKPRFLQMCFDQRLRDFVSDYLEFYEQGDHGRWCEMLDSMYRLTSKLISNVCKIDNIEGLYMNLLEKLFQEYIVKYGQFEIENLNRVCQANTMHDLQQLEKFNIQQKSWSFKKADEIIDPFDEFHSAALQAILIEASSAWNRCSLLSIPDKESKTLNEILEISIFQTIKNYAMSFLTTCCGQIKVNDSWTQIPRFLLMAAQIHDVICELNNHFNQQGLREILVEANISGNFQTKLNGLMSDISHKIEEGLQICVDHASNLAKSILSNNQKKTDYISNDSLIAGPSQASDAFCKMVTNLLGSMKNTFTGENRYSFLYALGKSLLETVKKHICNYKFNLNGGIELIFDVIEYQKVFAEFESDTLNESCDEMVKICHLMQLPPDNIASAAIQCSFTNSGKDFAKALCVQRQDIKLTPDLFD